MAGFSFYLLKNHMGEKKLHDDNRQNLIVYDPVFNLRIQLHFGAS